VLLARDLAFSPFNGKKGDENEFAACSGAQTPDVINKEFKSEDPQVRHLGEPDTLVTISIGGNDIRFAPVLKYCLTHKDCVAHEKATVEEDLAKVKPALPKVLNAIRASTPRAKIIVLGYPNFMPASGPCRAVGGTLKYLFKMPADSVEFIHNKINELNADIHAATRKHSGVSYVGPDAEVWAKHTICGHSSWFVKVDLKHALELHTMAFFHPTARGQRELEQGVLPLARRLTSS
jgi:lysophospholipase L1-like esterase